MMQTDDAVCLTFLAPSRTCNQSCPGCIISEVNQEPVTGFELTPSQYAFFLESFLDGGIPVSAVSFQGYEVTMPESWPYVEAVFEVAKQYRIKERGFVTNGMLLHKYTDRILKLEPSYITVSLDAAHPEINNKIRGHKNAFDLTCRGIREFLNQVPEDYKEWYSSVLTMTSTLYSYENFESLKEMPALIRSLGLSKWTIGCGVEEKDGHHSLMQDREILCQWMEELWRISYDHGVNYFLIDEYGDFEDVKDRVNAIRNVDDTDHFYRILPSGHVARGGNVKTRWTPDRDYKWNPLRDDLLKCLGYDENPAEDSRTQGKKDDFIRFDEKISVSEHDVLSMLGCEALDQPSAKIKSLRQLYC